MVETVVSIGMPIAEHLLIKKNRILPPQGNPDIGRIAVATGIHGDELEGQYICYELTRRIAQNPECLFGTVDVYPALNPLGIDSGSRAIPKIDMDMNRMFPGSDYGTMMEKAAARIIEDMVGADICVDLHASDTFVKEMPQVRISEEFKDFLLPYARYLNADLIWVNATATVHEATLAHSLNALSIPALVIEMGLGNRINRRYGNQITDGIFALMHHMGIWNGEVPPVKASKISLDGGIDFFRANETGIFLPEHNNGDFIQSGDIIGKIVSTLTGEIKEVIVAKRSGLLFTLREHPLVYEGALLARILAECEEA